MKVLLLTCDDHFAIYSKFYTGVHKQLGSMDIRRLHVSEQVNLRLYFAKRVNMNQFDRIILSLTFEVIKPQRRFLRTVDNLVFLDTDAHESPTIGSGLRDHLAFYKKMPWVRIVVRNYRAMRALQREGLDAWCAAKGFNPVKYQDKGTARTTDLIVIENADDNDFPLTKAFIKKLKASYPETATENNILGANTSALPQARIAICADIGRREYSGKVFNAMACGCLVMSYDQGDDENFYLSLKDMENIVLFNSFHVFCEKLALLRNNPQLLQSIAQKGQQFAQEQHKEIDLGRQAGKYIAAGLRESKDFRIGIAAFGWRL